MHILAFEIWIITLKSNEWVKTLNKLLNNIFHFFKHWDFGKHFEKYIINLFVTIERKDWIALKMRIRLIEFEILNDEFAFVFWKAREFEKFDIKLMLFAVQHII